MSKEAFTVIDSVLTIKKFKEKKLYPLLGAVFLFFAASFFVIVGYALSSASKEPEDVKYLEGIKRELFKLPWK